MHINELPIGVFDSGLGGLTAVREIKKILPGEDILYFGDTARLPMAHVRRKSFRNTPATT